MTLRKHFQNTGTPPFPEKRSAVTEFGEGGRQEVKKSKRKRSQAVARFEVRGQECSLVFAASHQCQGGWTIPCFFVLPQTVWSHFLLSSSFSFPGATAATAEQEVGGHRKTPPPALPPNGSSSVSALVDLALMKQSKAKKGSSYGPVSQVMEWANRAAPNSLGERF